MKTAAKVVVGLLAAYLVLMGGSGLAIRALLSTSLGDRLRQEAQSALPVEASLSGGAFDVLEWMRWRPALALHDLEIGNPEGYGEEPLLTADRVFVRAGLPALLNGETRVDAIEIDRPAMSVRADESGRTNVEALMERIRQASGAGPEPDVPDEDVAVAVSSLLITQGRVVYSRPGEPDFVAQDVNLRAENLQLEEAFDFSARLSLFETGAVEIRLDGTAGPLAPGSLPTQGRIGVEAIPHEIPSAFRQRVFGSVLDDPGGDSRLLLEADLEGDLLGAASGAGNVQFTDVRLGQESVSQFPVAGEAQILLTLLNPVADPAFHVIMPDASLTFGLGRWQGGIEAQYEAGLVLGKSTGAISDVDINEMLTAFTDSNDVAFGRLEMPRYEIRFSGRDSDQIFRSLSGAGRIELADGRFEIFDTLQTIEGHAQKLLSGSSAAGGSTSFVSFGSDFEIANERVQVANIALQGENLQVSGAGSFGFDQSLDLDLNGSVSGALAQLLGGRQDESGAAWVTTPLRVRGTLANPSVTPDFGRLIKEQAVQRATGILDSLLGGGGGQETPQSDDAEAEDQELEEPSRPRLPFDLGGLLRNKLGSDESQTEEGDE